MPYLKTIKYPINRKFSFQFCTPTEDISTPEIVLKYLNPSASYSFIPGIQNTSLLDPERLLLHILPFTEDCMVDITMPYVEVTKKKNPIKHFGRYIICNKQLVGIKIKPSDHWPKAKTITQEIPAIIENFYKEQGITSYQREIPIGEILVATRHFKIAPLFASELSSMFENTTIQVLNEYYSLGCQIFSIVNDLTEEKRKTLKDPFDILKNYRRQTTIVLYCGMHMALDPNQVYKTKSYALQTSSRIKKIHITKFNEIYTEQFICDLDQTKKGRKLNTYEDSKPLTSDIQIIDCSNLRIKFSFDKIYSNFLSRDEEPMDVEEENDQQSIKENDLMLYLWHVYVDVNKKKPFTLPCPMNQKDQNLLKRLIKLSEISNVTQTDLVQFLKLDAKLKIPKKYDSHNFKAIIFDRIPRQAQHICLYFSLKQRMAINSIEKDESFMRQVEQMTINCSGCIPQQFLRTLENDTALQKASVTDEDQKFVEKFLKRKTGVSLELFYFQMAKYFPKNKIVPQFLERMFDCLKLKVKAQYSGTPFQSFVLQSTFNEISHIFVESQQKLFQQTVQSLKTEEDVIRGEENQNLENNFRNFIKKVKYHCNAQKKSNYACHICASMFHKKEKLSYGRLCIGCNNFVCYSCFDMKTGETAQSEEIFQQCLICQNRCDCQKCIKKKSRMQPEYPQRTSLFRPSTSLYNSIENIGMNVEQNLINGSQNTIGLFVKSQQAPIVSNSFTNLPNTNFSKPLPDQTSIKPCWTCQLANRVDRIIQFSCHVCKDIRCLSCEKAENPNRNWVLRGCLLCNKCFQDEKQNTGLKSEVRNLKGKIVVLQHEIVLFKRQKFQNQIFKDTSPFGNQIYEEGNEYETQYNQEQKNQKGGATPIFDRSFNMGNKGKQSPLSFNIIKKSSENGSIASFGDKKQTKNNQKNGSSRNSSNSSIRSVVRQNQTKKRKNSGAGSERKSSVSFQNKKPSKAYSNSSRNSNRSSVKENKSNRSSVESGQYQDSSSSQKLGQQPKAEWKKNIHRNQNTQEKSYENPRGGYRGRGRGNDRGGRGNQSFDNRNSERWENRRGQRNDQSQRQRGNNGNQRGSNQRWQQDKSQDDYSRQGYNNKREGNNDRFKERNNSYSNDKFANNKRPEEQNKKNDQENKNFYLGKIQSKSNYNNEDIDY